MFQISDAQTGNPNPIPDGPDYMSVDNCIVFDPTVPFFTAQTPCNVSMGICKRRIGNIYHQNSFEIL